jgi:hypothetical protein
MTTHPDMSGHDEQWHLDGALATDYRDGRVSPVLAASVEQHLTGCPSCRVLVPSDTARLDRIWGEVLEVVEAPEVTWLERTLAALGVSGATARLVAATPALRGACLTALSVVVVLALVAGQLSERATTAFVALAPVLPLVGVALAFGPRTDPMSEMAAASPYSLVRLLAVRTAFVVATALAPAALVAQLLPGGTWLTAGWLLPALAMCTAVLAAARRLEPALTAAALSAAWAALTVWGAATGDPVLREHTALVQLASLVALGAAVWSLVRNRHDLVPHRRNA